MGEWRREVGGRGSKRRTARAAFLVAALSALLAVGCRDEATTTTPGPGSGSEGSSVGVSRSSGAGDFGSLINVCQKGEAKGATAQGVTDTQINLGVISDIGFTQNHEFPDAAKAFTEWCNAAGGINGRKLTYQVRDTNLFDYRPRILDGCAADFMLVGGSGAFESTGTKDRVQCLLPDISAQVISFENLNADLQVLPYNGNRNIDLNEGYYHWLVDEKYPDTKDKIGVLVADTGITKVLGVRAAEVFTDHLDSQVVFNNVYPPIGVTEWTPYAQAIADAGVEGLVFLGDQASLAKLEQALVDINFKPAWIDADNNGYSDAFIKNASTALDEIPNYSAPFVYPIEAAADNPPTQQLLDIVHQYVPDAVITGSLVEAWSSWLIFATAARDCGSELTRKCALEKAQADKAWDGGGLTPAVDLGRVDDTRRCVAVVEASSQGWKRLDVVKDDDQYLCFDHHLLKTQIPKAVTLADVGLTMADFK